MSTVEDLTTTAATNLAFDSAGTRMTAAEFDAIEEWDEPYRCELIRGVFIVSPYPSPPHGGVNGYLGNLLFLYKHDQPDAPIDGTLTDFYVATTDETRRSPDRVIWTGLDRDPKPSRDIPSIVVEVVSPGKRAWLRDYVDKRDEYLAIGVKEYWVVDRFARNMSVFIATESGFSESLINEDESYETDLLPGFTLKLSDLLAEGDRWEETE